MAIDGPETGRPAGRAGRAPAAQRRTGREAFLPREEGRKAGEESQTTGCGVRQASGQISPSKPREAGRGEEGTKPAWSFGVHRARIEAQKPPPPSTQGRPEKQKAPPGPPGDAEGAGHGGPDHRGGRRARAWEPFVTAFTAVARVPMHPEGRDTRPADEIAQGQRLRHIPGGDRQTDQSAGATTQTRGDLLAEQRPEPQPDRGAQR